MLNAMLNQLNKLPNPPNSKRRIDKFNGGDEENTAVRGQLHSCILILNTLLVGLQHNVDRGGAISQQCQAQTGARSHIGECSANSESPEGASPPEGDAPPPTVTADHGKDDMNQEGVGVQSVLEDIDGQPSHSEVQIPPVAPADGNPSHDTGMNCNLC